MPLRVARRHLQKAFAVVHRHPLLLVALWAAGCMLVTVLECRVRSHEWMGLGPGRHAAAQVMLDLHELDIGHSEYEYLVRPMNEPAMGQVIGRVTVMFVRESSAQILAEPLWYRESVEITRVQSTVSGALIARAALEDAVAEYAPAARPFQEWIGTQERGKWRLRLSHPLLVAVVSVVVGAGGVMALWLVARICAARWARVWARRQCMCLYCGYELGGTNGRCPECGAALE